MYTRLFILIFFLSCFYSIKSANEEAANLGKVFEEMDANGNQKVTVKEVSKYLQSKGLGLDKDSDDFKKIVQSFFDSYDKNKDKAITKEEFVPKHDEL